MEAHAGTIAIIVAIIGSAIALWRVNKVSSDRLHGVLGAVLRDIADLRERMTRLEGLFEGFTRRPAPGDAD